MSRKKVCTDSKKPLLFTITKAHCKGAKCKDPSQCVVARAINDAVGDLFDAIQVGAGFTKILQGSRVVRYRTPAVLAKAIPVFDKTGEWPLPEGQYKLLSVDKGHKLNSITSGDRKKKPATGKAVGGGHKKFVPRKLSTRTVLSSELMLSGK